MAAVKTYRDLIAWQKAMDLACGVYRLTSSFPREEMYGLTHVNSESLRYRWLRTSRRDRRGALESSGTS
jgi:hypothetical protein